MRPLWDPSTGSQPRLSKDLSTACPFPSSRAQRFSEAATASRDSQLLQESGGLSSTVNSGSFQERKNSGPYAAAVTKTTTRVDLDKERRVRRHHGRSGASVFREAGRGPPWAPPNRCGAVPRLAYWSAEASLRRRLRGSLAALLGHVLVVPAGRAIPPSLGPQSWAAERPLAHTNGATTLRAQETVATDCSAFDVTTVFLSLCIF